MWSHAVKLIIAIVAIGAEDTVAAADGSTVASYFEIAVVEKGTGWPVPLVKLRTNHQVSFVTDNAGVVAVNLPELMGRETWFEVKSDGYEVQADGFGYRGVRLTPRAGEKATIEVARTSIAQRMGRLTGAGLFAESQKLGRELDWPETGVLGCDSVQNAVHGGKLLWAWGDTSLAGYPLGIFDTTSATTAIEPLTSLEPPLRVRYDYFRDQKGKVRGVAPLPGDGPTWLSGYVSLPDVGGRERLVACYSKIKPPLDAYECGLCVWNDQKEVFERHKVIWKQSTDSPECPPVPLGHPIFWTDAAGKRWLLFGDPLPKMRMPATYEAWQDPEQWEVLRPQASLAAAGDGVKPDQKVVPHSGSVAWNKFRRRWVTVFMEKFGLPSAFGELWYAEADSPIGPWGPAVKILSHANYTFYNPRLHAEFTPAGSPHLFFEGTYTQTFADRPTPTPRYDYNQILYRLDLDDPALKPSQSLSPQSAEAQ
jgi:hypothetical protein